MADGRQEKAVAFLENLVQFFRRLQLCGYSIKCRAAVVASLCCQHDFPAAMLGQAFELMPVSHAVQLVLDSGTCGIEPVGHTRDTNPAGGAAMGWVKKSASVVKAAPRRTMAAAHVFTRYTHPRYELRDAARGTVPCANVPHVVEELHRLRPYGRYQPALV